MAYNQQQQGGYGQYNPYGQSGNPYGQQQQSNPYEQPYGHNGNYSERPDLEHHSSSRYDEESAQGGSYEMSGMNGRDPNRILNEVRNMDEALKDSERRVEELRMKHDEYMKISDTRDQDDKQKEIDIYVDDFTRTYNGYKQRIIRIKKDPESRKDRNKAQVNKVERQFKAVGNLFQQAERDFRQRKQESIARQYRIVRPDASEAEVREAVESGGNQVFSQALLSSDRRGDAQRTALNVRNRHQEIQKIEQDIATIAQMWNDVEAAVVQQEPAVQDIEDKGAQATGHVAQANTELDGAVKKARSARKKKWMCLGIALLIIIIIVVVVVVVVEVTKH